MKDKDLSKNRLRFFKIHRPAHFLWSKEVSCCNAEQNNSRKLDCINSHRLFFYSVSFWVYPLLAAASWDKLAEQEVAELRFYARYEQRYRC